MLETMTVTAIDDIYTVDSPKGRYVQMKNRRCYGLTFCYGGQITYYQKGKATVSDRDHMVLLPQGQNYELEGDASGLFPVIDVRCTPDFQITAPTAFRIRHPDNYLRDYERLKDLYLLRSSQAKCMSLLYDMLDRIAGDNAPNPIAAAAGAYVAEHYADPELTN